MESKNPFSKQAAKASWAIPLITFGMMLFGTSLMKTNYAAFSAISMIVPVLLLVGFILGIVGLFGIKRHGKDGMLLPSIIGILLNGGLLGWLLYIAYSAYTQTVNGG